MLMKAMNPYISIAKKEIWIDCKYWLDQDDFDLEEAFTYNMSQKDKKEIRKIVYEHFEYIEQQWDEFQRRRLQ